MEVPRPLQQILAGSERPVVFLAHQDDELGCSGILQRLRDRVHVVFMTNGDGRAAAAGKDLEGYAETRKEEALKSLGTAGVSDAQVRFLGHSETEIHRNLAKLKKSPIRLAEVVAFFEPIRRSVAEVVYEFRPDLAFAVGYQGGHPGHDLAHFFCALALRVFERDAETRVPLFQFPEYELGLLLPMRFRPWYPGERYWIVLDRYERDVKRRMAGCHASQRAVVRGFRGFVGLVTLPQRLVRRENPVERFFGREQLIRVPEGFDYRRKPYRVDFLNYPLRDFQGTRITFRDCIRPLVASFEEAVLSTR